jgi:Cof subfamily protein (haloacid dehalogenase superfamily)
MPPLSPLSPQSLPRLVATDLDGTIIRSDGTISTRTVKALAAAEKAGATVVLVTGRPPRWISGIAEQTDHHGIVICSNGAIVYDLPAERVVQSTLIPSALVRTVVGLLSTALPDLGFAVENGFDVYRSPAYRGGWSLDVDPHLLVHDLDVVIAQDAAKVLASHPEMDADELLVVSRGLAGHLIEATHSNGRGLVEMGPIGVTKGTALAALATELGIAQQDVIAFGDMPNDLPMLAWAGTSYAMANAHPDVLIAVDLKAPSNDEDGVALVLEELFS